MEYDYIKEKTPPVREDRLGSCGVFGGTCCGLSNQSQKGCLNTLKRTFSQTQGCQLNLSLAILNTIRDSVIIVHGPLGCGGGSSIFSAGLTRNLQRMRDPGASGLVWINTNLDETDVIKGGEQKLKEAILYADRELRPSSIIIVNSCVPALIGDDIDAIVAEVQPEVNAKVMPVHCEGFKTKIMASAYDSVYHGILRHMIREPDETTRVNETDLEKMKVKYRISRTVNVFNVSSMSRTDETELARIIKGLDLNVNFFPCYAHPNDFDRINEAALNVSICATHDDYFSGHLKEKYGIPFIIDTIPIGIKNTNRWILEIAKFFEIEESAEKLIATETRALEEALVPYRQALTGKRVFLTGGEIRIFATANLFENLGMKVIGFKSYHYDHFVDGLLDNVTDKENVSISVGVGQPFEQVNVINKLKPDIFVGHSGTNGVAAKQGIPVFPIFGQTANYMGYSGVFEVARRLNRILKNPSFNRNLSENTELPYFKDWFEKDAFSYIAGGQDV
jgi:nitrogenase molybdenum-iron protein alpha chain